MRGNMLAEALIRRRLLICCQIFPSGFQRAMIGLEAWDGMRPRTVLLYRSKSFIACGTYLHNWCQLLPSRGIRPVGSIHY